MKNPNSCSINIYMRHTNLNLYLATTKVFYSFVLNNKVIYPIIFLFFFLTFSSHSLTLLHIIYQLVLGNKYCKFHLSCWYQPYSFPIYQLLKNGVRKTSLNVFLQKAEITLKTLFIVGVTAVFVFTFLRQVMGLLWKNQSCDRPQPLAEPITVMES